VAGALHVLERDLRLAANIAWILVANGYWDLTGRPGFGVVQLAAREDRGTTLGKFLGTPGGGVSFDAPAGQHGTEPR